jgi:hypothetical protein
MADPKEPDAGNPSIKPLPELQQLREWMATVISLVIVALAAFTMYFTFRSAGEVPLPKAGAPFDAKEYADAVKLQSDAFGRQKDIMLYALALFGTVTGYYLGRVPAEANARRAERTADTAQQQLTKTQDKLVDASAGASTASAEVARVSDEKRKVSSALVDSAKALREVRATVAAARTRTDEAVGRSTLSATTSRSDSAPDLLQQAEARIDAALARIDAQSLS